LGLSVPQYFNEFTVSSGHGPIHTHGWWVGLLQLLSGTTLKFFG